jgi:hypothetical protein
LLVLIENSQGFKNFLGLFESFVWKLFKILYLFLEELLWERTSIKMLFSFFLIQTYASLLAKEWITTVFYIIKIVFLKDIFKHYFIKYYYLLFQRIYSQTLVLFCYASKVPFAKFTKFYWKILSYFENLFLTVPLWYFEF